MQTTIGIFKLFLLRRRSLKVEIWKATAKTMRGKVKFLTQKLKEGMLSSLMSELTALNGSHDKL
jgi:hypothetical protein